MTVAHQGVIIRAMYENLLSCNFSIDTRTLRPGEVFVALDGGNTSGNHFVLDALEKGAYMAIASQEFDDQRVITCPNTLDFLYSFANQKRKLMHAKVVAVTGSVGKTTVKESLYEAIRHSHTVFRSYQNFNNHIGVPLNILNTPMNADFAIYEIGISAPNEMNPLTLLVKPDVAIITAVATTHLEFFSSMMGIADEKIQIINGMTGGTLILNAENAFYDYMSKIASNAGIRVLPFYKSPIHEALTALGLNSDLDRGLVRLPGRGAIYKLRSDMTLIDQSYNAAPASMRFAIQEFHEITAKRKILVLGDMLELGKDSALLHEGLLPLIDKYLINRVFCCGPQMSRIFDLIPEPIRGKAAQTVADLFEPIKNEIQPEDAILIKGSHGNHLEKLVEYLMKEFAE